MTYAAVLGLVFVQSCHCHFLLCLVLHRDYIGIHQIIVDVMPARRVQRCPLLCGLVLHLVRVEAAVGLVVLAGRRSGLDHLYHLLTLKYLLFFITAERPVVVVIFTLGHLLVLRWNARHSRFLEQLMPFLLPAYPLLHGHLRSLKSVLALFIISRHQLCKAIIYNCDWTYCSTFRPMPSVSYFTPDF